MIAFVLSQESVPLQDPSAGWQVNYGIWIRAVLLSGVITHTLLVQAIYLVNDIQLSSRQFGLIITCVAVGYSAIYALVTAFLVFPIPFMSISTTPFFFTLLIVSFRAVVGRRAFGEMMTHRDQLLRFQLFLSAQTLMTVVYPAYQILFRAASETGYELIAILLLPVIKLIMKNLVSLSIGHMEDMMPEAVIFTVDFFNALYIATCMQSASSTTTVAAIMVMDLTQTAMALRSLYRGTSSIAGRLHETFGTAGTHTNLLTIANSLCRSPNTFAKQERSQIRLRSCLSYRLSPANSDFLDSLEKYRAFYIDAKSQPHASGGMNNLMNSAVTPAGRTIAHRPLGWRCTSRHRTTVHPVTITHTPVTKVRAEESRHTEIAPPSLPEPQLTILRETLEILFTTECIVLTEYVESVIPMFYANFILVMVRLPSAQYHTELAGMTRENVGATVNKVYVYALLEFASFVLLAVVMQRKCGVRALYHLSFVLETQMPLIQGKLMTWMLLTLTSRVVHFGTFSIIPSSTVDGATLLDRSTQSP
ncbi:hypothetical protein BBJ28_00025965 [Nothophytophthora sp. Chile5]|nr:hypothetical protein BBJ28_00025965 [Nothophytophthora sp. Chile5]